MSIIYEKKDRIAYITLNRPHAHNALDPETIVQLISAWENFRDDSGIRCAIVTGAGEHTFCAGADLGTLVPLFTGGKTPVTEAEKKVAADPMIIQKALLRDLDIFKPIIAGINGQAIAGGLELLYSTDIRISAQGARFGLQEVKWGIFPMGGSSVKLSRQIPYARAMEMLLTGELIEADEALALGLINRVVPRDRVMEECERLAKIIIKNGPVAVSAVKKAVLSNIGVSLAQGLAREVELAIPVFLSQDAQEGPRAFKEKREPKFKGK
ncbi:MAG: crotonase/enoyl-CoA hydratase family protein [Desulfobacteraceae bacterium]|nr:crotonase/enoyl-CoA hydratase family protein [Desulfobacteraceae bacterium]